jgi:hypothetical protein
MGDTTANSEWIGGMFFSVVTFSWCCRDTLSIHKVLVTGELTANTF